MSSRPSRGAARLAAILDALPDALVLVNANGTVVNANTIALEAFEAPGTALVGRGLLDLLPQFDSRLIPGSMRRPETIDQRGRTKPTRMIARRTDGSEFPVEVTSANLENGQQAYDSYGPTPDELLMLVVRDLSGTVDTEAELARSQRQTEMILRAAAEGVVGTDTEGRVVLVNPAAAQILGYRASDLGGQDLHALILHSRADGEPFAYEESPLADTLRSGRKHRVRGQVLWSKSGNKVPVDLTTAPVRDGDQLVGAVMTFTDRRPYDSLVEEKDAEATQHAEEIERIGEEHAAELAALRERHAAELAEVSERHEEELAAGDERYAALGEREKDRYEALTARHDQLLSVLGQSLRGPLDQLRGELSKLAADDTGQLWPEANQVLHHLAAGYSRITTLVDNVLGYQRLDAGAEQIVRTNVMLDAVVAAGVDGAVELIGPGRVQFAVHAPPIEAEVDPQRLAQALAHLIADVAGVDATGNAPASAGGYMDNTVVVAAAQRGEVVRIEVRGPYSGGDPVHEPIVRGIVRAHGGVLQTHEVPGMSGSAFVLEVPIGDGAGAMAPEAPASTGAEIALPEQASHQNGGNQSGGRRRARRSSVDAFLESEVAPAEPVTTESGAAAPTGRRRRRTAAEQEAAEVSVPAQAQGPGDGDGVATGRRRGRPSPVEGADGDAAEGVSEGAVVMAGEHAAGTAAVGTGLGGTVPPQGFPWLLRKGCPCRPGGGHGVTANSTRCRPRCPRRPAPRARPVLRVPRRPSPPKVPARSRPVDVGGRWRRRPSGPPRRKAAPGPCSRFRPRKRTAHPSTSRPNRPSRRNGPSSSSWSRRATPSVPSPVVASGTRAGTTGCRTTRPTITLRPSRTRFPRRRECGPARPRPQLGPTRRRFRPRASPYRPPRRPEPRHRPSPRRPRPLGRPRTPTTPPAPAPRTARRPRTSGSARTARCTRPGGGRRPSGPAATAGADSGARHPLPPEQPAQSVPRPGAQPRVAQPLPAEAAAPIDPNSTQGRAFSVRTLGQGVPFSRQSAPNQPGAVPARAQAQAQQTATPPPHQTNGSGRRRKLGTPPSRPPSAPKRRRARTRRLGRPPRLPGRGCPERPRAPVARTP